MYGSYYLPFDIIKRTEFKGDESNHNRLPIKDIKIFIYINDRSSLKDQRIRTFMLTNGSKIEYDLLLRT